MPTQNPKHFLWTEKHRPSKISECILSDEMKDRFSAMVDAGELQNMILCGPPGTGKTTVAIALCEELKCDYIMINASVDGNIDLVRTNLKQFASTTSLTGGLKVIILDEIDNYNSAIFQNALRAFIEEFALNCRFIMTANAKNRIIPALHSRCTVIEYKIPTKEKPVIASAFMKRVEQILIDEGVDFDKKVLAELVMKYFPDFRRTLNELQKYSVTGKIDVGVLSQLSNIKIEEVIDYLKNKQFEKMRKWVGANIDQEPSHILREIYQGLREKLTDGSIPQAVLIIAEYDYKSAFVSDPEINLVACLTELMVSCEFK